MAEWHVSGSESESEPTSEEGIEVGGLRIPPYRVAELLQTIEKRKVLKLECLAGASLTRERRRHKKHRKKNVPSPTNSRALEEVSETASELRSTTSTDFKEGKWNNVSHFDYFHEDTDLANKKKQRKIPPGRKKEKKLASLDEIVADVKQQKQRYQEQQQQQSTITPEISCPNHYSTPHSSSAAHSAHTAQWSVPGLHHHNSTGTAAPKPAAVAVPNFTFDDDSDLEFPSSDGDMKTSVLSQINRVEKLLDEGLT